MGNEFELDNLIDNVVSDTKKSTPKNLDQNFEKNSSDEKRGKGRPNKGQSVELWKVRNELIKQAHQTKQSDSFNDEIIERVSGEVVEPENIEQFKELYSLSMYTILENYKAENEEKCKQNPYYWYKQLIIEIKRNVPKVRTDEVEKLNAVWDILSEFLYYIGLYPTFETFSMLTNVYMDSLKARQGLNPRYAELVKKIEDERESARENELAFHPYTQANKMFLHKVHGHVEQNQPKQIEVTHHLESFDNISAYRLTDEN